MGKSSDSKYDLKAVSIITCTKRPEYINNIFSNYSRQRFMKKELIIILNNDQMKLFKYRKLEQKYENVHIYKLPEKTSLGRCLNLGVKKSKYGIVAKFDDDDYYAPNYLTDSMQALKKSKADIVGKRAHFMYLEGSKVLLLRYYSYENRYVPIVQGATLLVKRNVFNKVAFSNRNRGESIKFCSDSRVKGFKIFSGDKYNFAAVRRKFSINHTWIISDKRLLSGKVKIFRVNNFKNFVTHPRNNKSPFIVPFKRPNEKSPLSKQ